MDSHSCACRKRTNSASQLGIILGTLPSFPTTVRQTTEVIQSPTLAELTSDSETSVLARMDERNDSLKEDYKLAVASLATANAMGPYDPRASV
jgi:hypothetical protein